ncbi:hypothetical protein P171DRAFT_506297, partial [Karstenula rhodostoma CBS 690.94]
VLQHSIGPTWRTGTDQVVERAAACDPRAEHQSKKCTSPYGDTHLDHQQAATTAKLHGIPCEIQSRQSLYARPSRLEPAKTPYLDPVHRCILFPYRHRGHHTRHGRLPCGVGPMEERYYISGYVCGAINLASTSRYLKEHPTTPRCSWPLFLAP